MWSCMYRKAAGFWTDSAIPCVNSLFAVRFACVCVLVVIVLLVEYWRVAKMKRSTATKNPVQDRAIFTI